MLLFVPYRFKFALHAELILRRIFKYSSENTTKFRMEFLNILRQVDKKSEWAWLGFVC